MDGNHPDLSGNFDVASSCTDYLPLGTDDNSHGTQCAALAAAGADNGECAVGIAPGATHSGCRTISVNGTSLVNYKHLYNPNLPIIDVSSNSYGLDACGRIPQGERRLGRQLQATCPFTAEDEASPCMNTTDCAGADWSATGELSDACEAYIVEYCRFRYETEVTGCLAYLDFFVRCEYGVPVVAEMEALALGVTSGRGGKGIVYLFAAGNEYGIYEDVNFEAALNSRFTIT